MPSQRSYVLISPCRDEAPYVARTLETVAAQTVVPTRWVIVDDGSTDGTAEILADYAKRLPYLEIVRRENRGNRSVGPGVIEAFYAGLEHVDLGQYRYVCKLDVDLDLPPRYFETLIEWMEREPRLGTCSGKPYFRHPDSGELVEETSGDEMSVGMTKFYRVECFREIGGFVRQVMWDGIDCHRCRMLGWIAASEDREELRFTHLRAMGSSHQGLWTGRLRWGYGQYFMGTSFPYLLASAAFRFPRHPIAYGSVGMVWGYLRSLAKGMPRYDDDEFRRFLHDYQRECLLFGKREATRRANDRQASVWRARHPLVPAAD